MPPISIERGAVIGGRVIPGSEDLFRRRADAMWSWDRKADRPDLRLRHGRPITLFGSHWAGGPIRVGELAAVRTVEAMRARKRADGSLADVSCHLVFGWDGVCWQTADFQHATVHMGRAYNLGSIGAETSWPGYASLARELVETLESRNRPVHPGYHGPVDVRRLRGRNVEILRPSPELVAGVVRVAEFLASLATTHPELGIAIPRELAKPGRIARRGHLEHREVTGADKDDAGGYFTEALAAAGWAR